MTKFFRDPIYSGALAALVAVAVIATAAGAAGGGSSDGSSQAARDATVTPVATTPAATALPTTSPIAVPTPQLYEVLLDARRVLDLSQIADALASYHQRFGAYPNTSGTTTAVCKNSGDAGCALSAVRTKLSYNDGTYDYLYRSDGSTFTLITRLQTPVTPDGCNGEPAPAPAVLPTYCIGPKER